LPWTTRMSTKQVRRSPTRPMFATPCRRLSTSTCVWDSVLFRPVCFCHFTRRPMFAHAPSRFVSNCALCQKAGQEGESGTNCSVQRGPQAVQSMRAGS
jgi:hypothetical protein